MFPTFFFIGDLAKSIRSRTKVTFGLYHSLYEWFHPLYLEDKANGFKTRNYVTVSNAGFYYTTLNKNCLQASHPESKL